MAIADIQFNQYAEPLGIYAEGFLDSAAAIFERAETGRGLVDFAFYPGAYCLRHGLELFIKQMSVYAAYIEHDAARLYLPKHFLAELWSKQRPFVAEFLEDQRTSAGRSGEELDELQHHLHVVEGLIEELDRSDPGSMLFRYPERVSRDEGPRVVTPTPPDHERVNLRDWQAKAEAALLAVSSLLFCFDEYASAIKAHRGHQFVSFQEYVLATWPPKNG